jgi:SAM-dependent methyltransferase
MAEPMPERGLLSAALRLGASVDALAALGALARVESEHLDVDPGVQHVLESIAGEVLGGRVDPGAGAVAAQTAGLAMTFLQQAVDLVQNPGRAGGWDQVNVPLLQGIGRMSMSVCDAVLAAQQRLDGLGERLAGPGGRMLDIGTGVGWLAIALARAHPGLHVVGVDVFEPALELARGNVAAEGLGDRVELRLQDAAGLSDPEGFDAAWVPMPFLAAPIVPAVLASVLRTLRPGGWALAGVFTGPPGDRLAELMMDLRTVRSGGHPWRPDELATALTDAGLSDAAEVPRSWAAPVRLVAARKA